MLSGEREAFPSLTLQLTHPWLLEPGREPLPHLRAEHQRSAVTVGGVAHGYTSGAGDFYALAAVAI
jgi:hypothetical protein